PAHELGLVVGLPHLNGSAVRREIGEQRGQRPKVLMPVHVRLTAAEPHEIRTIEHEDRDHAPSLVVGCYQRPRRTSSAAIAAGPAVEVRKTSGPSLASLAPASSSSRSSIGSMPPSGPTMMSIRCSDASEAAVMTSRSGAGALGSRTIV